MSLRGPLAILAEMRNNDVQSDLLMVPVFTLNFHSMQYLVVFGEVHIHAHSADAGDEADEAPEEDEAAGRSTVVMSNSFSRCSL